MGFATLCTTAMHTASLAHKQARRTLGASGVVLLFAADKVSPQGPTLCYGKFGTGTVKLQLPSRVAYLYRNAAEQWLAASAPGGFFGNAYSTFDKGVALLRSSASASDSSKASFAYDCALATWSAGCWQQRDSIVSSHPGFGKLRTLPGRKCSCARTRTRVDEGA